MPRSPREASIWVGTSGPEILELAEGALTPVVAAPSATFVAAHPSIARLYAVSESSAGSVSSIEVGAGGARLTRTVSSGGSGPCHLAVHPAGRWLYVANYGDGTAVAIALDDDGELTEDRVELPHAGSGPHAERQEGPHAHFVTLSPGAGHLVVADLGTDELRAYALHDGRPATEVVTTALPPGTGPRHIAVDGDVLYVAGELNSQIVLIDWDEPTGTGSVRLSVPATASAEQAWLSHIERVGRSLLVGVRGPELLSVLDLDADGVPTLTAEIATVAWPRHFAVTGDVVLVAGERADEIGLHSWASSDGGAVSVSEVTGRVQAPAPMCLVPQI